MTGCPTIGPGPDGAESALWACAEASIEMVGLVFALFVAGVSFSLLVILLWKLAS